MKRVHAEIKRRFDFKEFEYHLGTMIEIPRAALNADKMAEVAEFFSFGTNDLSQMTFGFSRDDIGAFMNDYLNKHIIDADPFQTIDVDGVGQLVEIAAEKSRKVPEHPAWNLRRAGRRSRVGGILLQGRALIRELLPVPGSNRQGRRRTGSHQGKRK